MSIVVVIFLGYLVSGLSLLAQQSVHHGQGEMAGEVTDTSVILQSRLTQGDQLVDGDLPGSSGIARFEIAVEQSFQNARLMEWIEATAAADYIIKMKVTELTPDTRYFYRLCY